MNFLQLHKKATQQLSKQQSNKENSINTSSIKCQEKNVKSIDISLVMDDTQKNNAAQSQLQKANYLNLTSANSPNRAALQDKKFNNIQQVETKARDLLETPKNSSSQLNSSRDNFFASLYNKAKVFSNHKEQLKQKEEEKELKECIFSPSINRNNSENKRTLDTFLEDQNKYEMNKQCKQTQLKQLIQQEEVKELTLKPKINANKTSVTRDSSVPIHERLYNLKDLKSGKNSISKLNEIVATSTDKNGQSSKQITLTNNQNVSISLNESGLFSPRINEKSKSLKRRDHISVILYNDAQRRNQQSRKESNERSMSTYNSNSSCTIPLNERSEQVYTNSFIRLFQNSWNKIFPQSNESQETTPNSQNPSSQKMDYLKMNMILELLLFITPSSQITNQTKLANPNLAKERSLVYDIWCNLKGDKFKGVSKRNLLFFLLSLQGIKNTSAIDEFTKIYPDTGKNANYSKQQSSTFNFESAAEFAEKTSPKNFTPFGSNTKKISQISVANSESNSVITNKIASQEETPSNKKGKKSSAYEDQKFKETMKQLAEKVKQEQQFEKKNMYGYFEGENWNVGVDQVLVQTKYDLLVKNRLNQNSIGNLSQRTKTEQQNQSQSAKKKKSNNYMSGRIISIDLKKPMTQNQHVDLLVKQRNMQLKKHESIKNSESERELEDCTFQPNLERNRSKMNNSSIGMETSLNLYKTMFKTSSQKRDKSTYDIEYEKQCDECTFNPDTSISRNYSKSKKQIDQSTTMVNRRDFEASVERIKQARKVSDNNSLMFQRGYHDLPNFQMISQVSNASEKQKQSFFSTQGPFRTFDY